MEGSGGICLENRKDEVAGPLWTDLERSTHSRELDEESITSVKQDKSHPGRNLVLGILPGKGESEILLGSQEGKRTWNVS